MSRKDQSKFRKILTLVALGLGVIFVAVFSIALQLKKNYNPKVEAATYNPQINPSDFTTIGTNKYFTLTSGKKMIYESETADGLERGEVLITSRTKNVMGVTTLVIRDKVWLNGVIIEDTRDYLAQNKKTGDVWYFGEKVDNYENGVLVSHEGSWLAGIDGALPGIWVKANPTVGETYRQEYYKRVAEDMAKVISINETVKISYGTFENCLKTYDFTRLDPHSKENKYYCPTPKNGPEAGTTVFIKDLVSGDTEELIDVKMVSTSGSDGED
ncbi:hypothetical protein HY008_01655 [Candidatus Woesebacteria bacterium]|nr:hypothetical protein [Candidatus Woesebacteria bacterium]